MELENVLHMRRSTRRFTGEQINEEDLEKLIAAAQTAPLAAGDDKTTHITVVQETKTVEEIRNACRMKSSKTGNTIDPFYGAQTIIFVSATDISEDHIEYCNAACIIENILLQATALNLGSVYIWGCLRKLRANSEVMERLALPDGYEILSAVAIGYPVEPLAEREKSERISVNRI